MVYPDRKVRLLTAFLEAFTRFDQAIIVDLMNISTEQIVKTRVALRQENGVILIGKNTISKLAVKILTAPDDPEADYYNLQKKYGKKPQLVNLEPLIKGKIGFVFCERSYVDVKPIIEKEAISMPAKAGTVAPSDVWLLAGPTFIDPGRIGEFQRLNINVKTSKSALEIIKDAKLCAKGEVVSETVAAMCKLMNIIPFQYSMALRMVYLNGQVIPEDVIKISPSDVDDAVSANLRAIAALSLEAGLPNALSVPFMILNSFKSVLSVALAADIKLDILSSLSTAAPAQATAQATGGAPAKAAPKVEEAAPEEEEVDMDMGDLFG